MQLRLDGTAHENKIFHAAKQHCSVMVLCCYDFVPLLLYSYSDLVSATKELLLAAKMFHLWVATCQDVPSLGKGALYYASS